MATINLERFNESQLKSLKRFCLKVQLLEFPRNNSILIGYTYLIEQVFENVNYLDTEFIQDFKTLRSELIKYEFELNYSPKEAFQQIQENCLVLLSLIESIQFS